MTKTPAAFRASMEMRLKNMVGANEGRALQRRRVLIVMERFIARLHHVLPETAVLKGGLALELRIERARATKDVDVRLLGDPQDLDARLRAIEAHRPDPEDHLEFAIHPDPHHPLVTGDGVKYDGYRFKVVAKIAGKTYVRFGLDVAYGDPILGEPDVVDGSDFFETYGIPRVQVRIYPPTTHLAEKLHAYTLPRDRVNTRMKDLVDMPLLSNALDGRTDAELRAAIAQTFTFRRRHDSSGCSANGTRIGDRRPSPMRGHQEVRDGRRVRPVRMWRWRNPRHRRVRSHRSVRVLRRRVREGGGVRLQQGVDQGR
ncbi:MAG: nucleotidyl transferase AbiEii/AbiGii toxin family protein [Myxococcota bacterium]